MTSEAGRSCPLAYRYGPQAIAQAPEQEAHTLYVVGGLYGNLAALDAIEAMALQEAEPVSLCFNGDFNWFNIDDASFVQVNRRVLRWHATAGNVEFELANHASDNSASEAGCGCAYPPEVDDETVARSNRIHARLHQTAVRHPHIAAQLAQLPMVARFRIGQARVGVVHGDADSLAGWRFGADAMALPQTDDWLERVFEDAAVDVFASSHTCLPAFKRVFGASSSDAVRSSGKGRPKDGDRHESVVDGGSPFGCRMDARFMRGLVVNNGAAGMPNFSGDRGGVITRISTRPAPSVFSVLYGSQISGAHVQALRVAFDAERWMGEFLGNWPVGSDAHDSYHARLCGHVAFEPVQALM